MIRLRFHSAMSQEEKWTEIVKVVYLKGIENNGLRAKVKSLSHYS